MSVKIKTKIIRKYLNSKIKEFEKTYTDVISKKNLKKLSSFQEIELVYVFKRLESVTRELEKFQN